MRKEKSERHTRALKGGVTCSIIGSERLNRVLRGGEGGGENRCVSIRGK